MSTLEDACTTGRKFTVDRYPRQSRLQYMQSMTVPTNLAAIWFALNRVVSWPIFNRMGRGGRLDASQARSLRGWAVVTNGTGNLFRIGKDSRFKGTVEFAGDNNRVLIGVDCSFQGKIFVSGNDQSVVIGDNSGAKGLYILCAENCDVRIGKRCMFSREIEIRTTDAHSVVDRRTGKRTNTPASIQIGDHVWVGLRAIITKGATVPSDSVVAAMSFVNGQFEEEGVILAGAPARVIKKGITWNGARKRRFSERELDHWKG
ncbi:acyltransferase [Mesorhizobium sp. LHD-90]|uniref:acyltransferase n=1 Tax=Mesorhizobium sp. LHD-90 TaxID=3071414 RepID=UPI0027E01E54|nr:acyltransferase [Mesorhizobium sp. LHD-90]MDQ6437010.1 acyltransferase [Mesorhizobium sp. LHD-90]